MEVVRLDNSNFKKTIGLAKEVLERSGLVVVPSDTAYGLAARADSSEAVKKVFSFKGRRLGKGAAVFLKDVCEIKKYARFNKEQEGVIRTLLPGCFTVILDSRRVLASELGPGDGTIGVRVIENKFIENLLLETGFPITATSANLSGRGPHYSIPSFLRTLSEKKRQMIDLIVDGGRLPRRPVSTVVRLTSEKIEILRKGVLNPQLVLVEKTRSEEETKRIARRIYKEILRGQLKSKAVLVILHGDLGVGKTVFAKGIGEIFGKEFVSPTFVLMDEYPINQPPVKEIYHLDLYRLESKEEIRELKLEEFLQKGNLMLVEWGEKLATFSDLKKQKAAFFLLQIKKRGRSGRGFKLYKL